MDFDFLAFDGPLAQRGIGVIAPFDLALERELWRWVPMEVSLHLARTPYEPVPVSMEMARLVSDSHYAMSFAKRASALLADQPAADDPDVQGRRLQSLCRSSGTMRRSV